MTRQIKKSLLASAVATAMGAGASVATADAILFPYLSKGPTVTTVVTVINTSGGEKQLHYAWNYKLWKPNETETELNQRLCGHDDQYRNTSKNDIVTFDAGRVLGDDLAVLFDDPGAGFHGATMEQRGYNSPFGLANAAWIGYLIVDNRYDDDGGYDGVFELAPNGEKRNQHVSLYGEAMSYEWSSGAAWGYEAYNPKGGGSYNFSYAKARNGEVLKGAAEDEYDAYRSAIDLVPVGNENVSIVERLLVTPTGDNMLRQDYAVKIRFGEPVRWGTDSKASEWYLYDRNEEPWSVNVAPQVNCIGKLTISAPAFWTDSAGGGGGGEEVGHLQASGGWTFIDPVAPPPFAAPVGTPNATPYKETPEAIVQKLEYDQGDAAGFYNTAVWLRDFDHD